MALFYAGTMGLVQRDGINRFSMSLTFQDSILLFVIHSQAGWMAGVGALMGPDPREVVNSDIIIMREEIHIYSITFMKHIQNARKNNNALFIVIDPYLTKTAKKDIHIKIRPGTD